MTTILAILAGIIGAAVGAVLGVAGAAILAPMLGITSFEGASGYFAVFIGGPIGAIAGLVIGVVLASRLRGVRSGGAVAGRIGIVFVAVIGLGAAVLGYLYFERDLVTTDGPPPQLAFEIRMPPGTAAPAAKDVTIHLDSVKSHMPGTILGDKFRSDGDRPVIVGTVEITYRESNRLLVLRLPNQPDQIFALKLGKDAKHAKELGTWQRVEYVAEKDQTAPRRATDKDNYEIRYRAIWAGAD